MEYVYGHWFEARDVVISDTNSFYMIIMTESSCNVKYIYLKQYVPLSMYTLVLDAETAPGFIYLQASVLSSDWYTSGYLFN